MDCFKPIRVPNPKLLKMYRDGPFVPDPSIPPYLYVPCGKCTACRIRRAQEWANRLIYEDSKSKCSYFITITSDDLHVPRVRGQMALSKPLIQKFFKRFRHYFNHEFKYYLAGEYGPKTHRPHYHFLIFIKDYIVDFDTLSECLYKAWPDGNYQIFGCSHAAIRYVTKYMVKAQEDNFKPYVKPFSLMSKGLGRDYVDDNSDHHNHDIDQAFFLLPDGNKSILPRYWKEKLYTEDERVEIANKVAKLHDLPTECYVSTKCHLEFEKLRTIKQKNKEYITLKRKRDRDLI